MNYFDINHFYKYGFALVEKFETEKNYIYQQMKNINWVENIYTDGDVYKVPDWVLDNVTAEEYHSPYDFKLIEDNCESLGSKFKRKKLGTYGLASSHSFYFGHHIYLRKDKSPG